MEARQGVRRKAGWWKGGWLVVPLALIACSPEASPVRDDSLIREVWLLPDLKTLELSVETCNADLSVDLEEAAEQVVVVLHVENDTKDDCLDSTMVELARPLGNRTLIDGPSQEVLPVQGP